MEILQLWICRTGFFTCSSRSQMGRWGQLTGPFLGLDSSWVDQPSICCSCSTLEWALQHQLSFHTLCSKDQGGPHQLLHSGEQALHVAWALQLYRPCWCAHTSTVLWWGRGKVALPNFTPCHLQLPELILPLTRWSTWERASASWVLPFQSCNHYLIWRGCGCLVTLPRGLHTYSLLLRLMCFLPATSGEIFFPMHFSNRINSVWTVFALKFPYPKWLLKLC